MRPWQQWSCPFVGLGSLACSVQEIDNAPPGRSQSALIEKEGKHAISGAGSRHAHRSQKPDRLRPIANCVVQDSDRNWHAYFGYDNPHDRRIALPRGGLNSFFPFPFDRGQPTAFDPGRHDGIVRVPWEDSWWPIQWKLGSGRAFAWRHSPRCVPAFNGATSATVLSESEALLSWSAASDYTTAMVDLVYDVCVSTSPGDCVDRFVVAATTSPGAASWTIGNLQPSTTYHFVVRARNQFGGEDRNSVEVTTRTCVAGEVSCDGTCTFTGQDAANCGACDNECPGGHVCDTGSCVCPCAWGCVSDGCDAPVEIKAGDARTCARQRSGAVACWGAPDLGSGSENGSASPLRVAGIDDAVQLSVGGTGACALVGGGQVVCWDQNGKGQAGNGSTQPAPTPVEVMGLTDVTEVSAGSSHACARLATGAVACWGANSAGQLGNGATTWRESVPVAVVGLKDAVEISAGGQHTCARDRAGDVWCWGANRWGQLGNGTNANSAVPIRVSGLSDVVGLSLGSTQTCALDLGGQVRCWGLGSPETGLASAVPLEVEGVVGAVEIGVGANHACARLESNEVLCWGSYDGSGDVGETPVVVEGLDDAVALAVGTHHVCALREAGRSSCWGQNRQGALGNGSTGDSHDEPQDVVPLLSDYCDDGKRDGDESDVDCGGSCAPCPNLARCQSHDDCAVAHCTVSGVCARPRLQVGSCVGQPDWTECWTQDSCEWRACQGGECSMVTLLLWDCYVPALRPCSAGYCDIDLGACVMLPAGSACQSIDGLVGTCDRDGNCVSEAQP